MKTITFYRTNYNRNIFNEKITLNLISFGKTGNDFETDSGTIIHIFDNVPYMRNITDNKGWFRQNIYHFNAIN